MKPHKMYTNITEAQRILVITILLQLLYIWLLASDHFIIALETTGQLQH